MRKVVWAALCSGLVAACGGGGGDAGGSAPPAASLAISSINQDVVERASAIAAA